MLQSLEQRVLLSVSVNSAKVLLVNGNSANNVIELKVVNNRLVVREGGVQTGSFAGVKSIVVNGLDGNDKVTIDSNVTVNARIDGGTGHDTLTGGSGGNVIMGQSGEDVLTGGAGVDALLGGSGPDHLDGGAGNDYLDGQGGQDDVSYANRTTGITAELGWATRSDANGNRIEAYTLGQGGAAGEMDDYRNIDTITGTSYNDKLTAVHSYSAANTDFDPNEFLFFHLFGGKGNDEMIVSSDVPDFSVEHEIFGPALLGGEGNDRLSYSGYADAWLEGDAGQDILWVDAAVANYVKADGGDGVDTQYVRGTPSSYVHYAEYAADDFENFNLSQVAVFNANGLDNKIYVTGGPEDGVTIHGWDGNDRIDLINAAKGEIYGDVGNDVIYGSQLADYISGGEGNDAIFGFGGNDTLNGGAGNDYFEGGAGNDSMSGGVGDDIFRGNAGVDVFYGNEDNDFFYSRDGEKDYLYGGTGTNGADRDAAEEVVDSVS